jgi:heme o synthase
MITSHPELVSGSYTNNKKILKQVQDDVSGSVKDYISLMKPRVMSLVVFTSLCGLLLARGTVHPFLGLVAIICISLGAGASAAINMWYDRDIDRIMRRTQNRPLVRGSIDPEEALSFGIILGFFSVFLMALCINFIAAALLCITILYYVFIYTIWLKRTSPQNIVIGGVAGALPPVIGMAVVENSISIEAIALFMIIFLWTPPHSWALALWRMDDYKNSKVPMMPLVKGELYTKYLVVFYSILMIVASLLPFFLGMAGSYYLVIAGILDVGFLYYVTRLFVYAPSLRASTSSRGNPTLNTKEMDCRVGANAPPRNDDSDAKRLFFYSIFYLFMIFLILGMRI